MTAPACDPTRCPLCGQPNQCALADGSQAGRPCWCSNVQIAPHTLARIPAPCQGMACICRQCAGDQTPAPVPNCS